MIAQLQSALFEEIFDLIVVELLFFEIRDKMALKVWVLRKWVPYVRPDIFTSPMHMAYSAARFLRNTIFHRAIAHRAT